MYIKHLPACVYFAAQCPWDAARPGHTSRRRRHACTRSYRRSDRGRVPQTDTSQIGSRHLRRASLAWRRLMVPHPSVPPANRSWELKNTIVPVNVGIVTSTVSHYGLTKLLKKYCGVLSQEFRNCRSLL